MFQISSVCGAVPGGCAWDGETGVEIKSRTTLHTVGNDPLCKPPAIIQFVIDLVGHFFATDPNGRTASKFFLEHREGAASWTTTVMGDAGFISPPPLRYAGQPRSEETTPKLLGRGNLLPLTTLSIAFNAGCGDSQEGESDPPSPRPDMYSSSSPPRLL